MHATTAYGIGTCGINCITPNYFISIDQLPTIYSIIHIIHSTHLYYVIGATVEVLISDSEVL